MPLLGPLMLATLLDRRGYDAAGYNENISGPLEGDPRAGTARTNWTGTDLLLADPCFWEAYVYVVEPGDPEVRGLFRRRAPGGAE